MRGCLWVVVRRPTNKLRGYLFFGDRFPRLRVYQVYVCPEFRSSGTARRLIEKLKAYGEDRDYLTITARVASELPANGFWTSLGFSITGRSPGKKKGRTINRYALALDVPSLFGQAESGIPPPADGPQEAIRIRPVLPSRSFVMDLNVLLDAVRDRDDGEATRILSMGFGSDMRLVVTPEFAKELERHSHQSEDPVLKLARALPTLPETGSNVLNPLVDELRTMINSTGTPKTGKRAANDASDLVHLASCIHHRIYGFITRDGPILGRAEELHEKYKLRVISPADLCEPLERVDRIQEQSAVIVGQQQIEIAAFREQDRDDVEKFLDDVGISLQDKFACLAPDTGHFPKTRSVVRVEGRIAGIGSWANRPSVGRESEAWLYVDEDSPCVDGVVDHLLEHSINRGNHGQLHRLDMKIGPAQVKIRDVAIKRGFCSPDFGTAASSGALAKVSMKGAVTKTNWQSFRHDFKDATGLALPSDLPEHTELVNTGVVLDAGTRGRRITLSLFDFETVISPGTLVCPGRHAVMIPVQERYARQLLSLTEAQTSFLAQREAALRLERAYFLAAGRQRRLPRGTIVVFYASRERREAVAIARVTFSGSLTKKEAVLKLSRQGVLTEDEIRQRSNQRDEVGAFTFDNLVVFREGISYLELKQMGCIDGANLVTVQKLPYDKFNLVAERAFSLSTS